MSKVILGVQLLQRTKDCLKVQELLSKYGCNISTRLGMHELTDAKCSSAGLIILEFNDGAEKQAAELNAELDKLDGVVVKKMEF